MIQSAELMPKRGQQSHPEGPLITVGPEERAQIKALRLAKGWHQKVLAAKAKTTQATISNLESGRHQQVNLKVYQRIMAALKTEGMAEQADRYYRRIVDGAATLTESDQQTVALLIDTLQKKKAQQQ